MFRKIFVCATAAIIAAGTSSAQLSRSDIAEGPGDNLFTLLNGVNNAAVENRLLDDWKYVKGRFLGQYGGSNGDRFARWIDEATDSNGDPVVINGTEYRWRYTIAHTGHAMTAAVQLNDKTVFDGLFREARKFMQKSPADLPAGDSSFADLYIATAYTQNQTSPNAVTTTPAGGVGTFGVGGTHHMVNPLVLAGYRWGNSGNINYHVEARKIFSAWRRNEAPSVRDPLFIRGVRDEECKAGFSNYGACWRMPMNLREGHIQNEISSPPYYHPEHYDIWASLYSVGSNNNNYWCDAADESRRALFDVFTNSDSGFIPNKMDWDGTEYQFGINQTQFINQFGEPKIDRDDELARRDGRSPNKDDRTYGADPTRYPFTLAVDRLFNGQAGGQAIAVRIMRRYYRDAIRTPGVPGITRNEFTWDGSRVASRNNSTNLATSVMLGVAIHAADGHPWLTQERKRDVLRDIWTIDLESEQVRSPYQGAVYMVGMLVASGKYDNFMTNNEMSRTCSGQN